MFYSNLNQISFEGLTIQKYIRETRGRLVYGFLQKHGLFCVLKRGKNKAAAMWSQHGWTKPGDVGSQQSLSLLFVASRKALALHRNSF